MHLIKTADFFFFFPLPRPATRLPLPLRLPLAFGCVYLRRDSCLNNLQLPGVCLQTSRFIIGASRARRGGGWLVRMAGTAPHLPHRSPFPSALVCVGGKNYSSYFSLSLGAGLSSR